MRSLSSEYSIEAVQGHEDGYQESNPQGMRHLSWNHKILIRVRVQVVRCSVIGEECLTASKWRSDKSLGAGSR
jgi:hypothetical protein